MIRIFNGAKIKSIIAYRQKTKGEEIANSITHGIGAGLSIAAMSILVLLASIRGDSWKIVSFSIYGTTLILLYLASTFYHAFPNPRIKRFFEIFDHCAIYLLIAGTYTPICLVTIRGDLGWNIFFVVWGIAIIGIVFKSFFAGRFKLASTMLYLAMGWLVLIAIKPIIDNMSHEGFMWLILGGLCYSVGIIFYLLRKIPYHHSIWHIFVLGGSTLQFFAILFYVLPK